MSNTPLEQLMTWGLGVLVVYCIGFLVMSWWEERGGGRHSHKPD